MEARQRPGSLTVLFGAESSRIDMDEQQIQAHLSLPALGTLKSETITDCSAARTLETGPFSLVESDQKLAGVALLPPTGGLEEATFNLYQQFFALLGSEWHPYRIWHYVPAINETGTGGLEHYRSFNLGRSRAFEKNFGAEAEGRMPAASAVGTNDEQLAFVFLAGREKPRFIENPEQVPAYEYPDEHGPKPPSFARATSTTTGRVYVSGTASIKGHQTVSPDYLAGQFETTLDNIRLVAASTGGPALDEIIARPDHTLKVYLRDRNQLPEVKQLVETHLGARETNTLYLEAAICRRELDLEIEMSYGG